MERLKRAFPLLFEEMQLRYNAPLGVIPADGQIDMEALAPQVHRLIYPNSTEVEDAEA